MNDKKCKHNKSFPYYGVMWCPDCGALRRIRILSRNSFIYASNKWLYPRGKDSVLKQLERIKEQ